MSFEDVWVSMSRRAMGKTPKAGYRPYEATAWELIKPLLAAGWCTRKALMDHTGRAVGHTLLSHKALLRKRGKDANTQYRLK